MAFYNEATTHLVAASKFDREGNYEDALREYRSGIDYLVAAIKHDRDPSSARKKDAEARALDYMDRAEAIKKMLDGLTQGGGGSGGTATAPKPPGDAGGEDAEAAKLKGALSGAIVAEKPNVKWDDVAGLEAAKDALKEAVILPVKFPQLFTGKRKPWRGIMLYGPPGTGKSHLARAVATEATSTFFSISASDLMSKWQGEAEKNVRSLFEMAREKKPSIVFIDEMDSLCGSRSEGQQESSRRVITEFLVQMDGVGKNMDGVLVLGATNTPWEIDAAMRRRFQKRIYIPLPEAHARAKMVEINLGDTPHSLTQGDFTEVGELTDGFSGSDLSIVVREALMEPLRKCRAAKFFRRNPTDGMYEPITLDPPCARCPLDMSYAKAPTGLANPCPACGACRITLYELETNQLHVPVVCMEDFKHVLKRAKASVSKKELGRYTEWTREFGMDGSEGGASATAAEGGAGGDE